MISIRSVVPVDKSFQKIDFFVKTPKRWILGQNVEKLDFWSKYKKIHYHSKLRKRRFLDKNVEKWIFGQNDDKCSIFGKKNVKNVEEVDFYLKMSEKKINGQKFQKTQFLVKNA